MNKKLILGTAAVAALTFLAPLSAASPFTMTPIDGGPGALAVLPSALNDQGVVVGEAMISDTPEQSFQWQAGEFESLDLGIWVDVNHQGQIVGQNQERAVLLTNGEWTILDDLPEKVPASLAFGINNLAQVVGAGIVEREPRDGAYPNPGYRVPVAWLEGTTITRLEMPDLRHRGGEATAINDLQQIIGFASIPRASQEERNIQQGLLWQEGQPELLANLHPQGGSRPEAINNHGLIVGVSDYQLTSGDWFMKATIWHNGAVEAIVPLNDFFNSQVVGVNDAGQVIGSIWGRNAQDELEEYAFLWSAETGLQNLNDLVDAAELAAYGAQIVHAGDINNRGEIVVTAVSADRIVGFLLTPTSSDGGGDQPGKDSDGDGVPDSRDQCPNTSAGAVVNEAGCSIAQLVPCEGTVDGDAWRSSLHYRATLRNTAAEFQDQGLISRRDLSQLMREARKSSCGQWWTRR